MITQCAWCKSIIVKGQRICNPVKTRENYSHGICIICKTSLLKERNWKPFPEISFMTSSLANV